MALRRTDPNRIPKTISPIVVQVLAVALTILMLLPLFWVFSVSLKTQADIFSDPHRIIPFLQFTPTGINYRQIFFEFPIQSGISNSFIVSAVSTLIAVSVGSITGYSLARFSSSANNRVLLFWLLMPRFIPSIVLAIPLLVILRNMSLLDSLPGLVISQTTLVLPFAILIMRDYFVNFPKSLSEAAHIDGASFFQVFRLVALPNGRPALYGAAMVCFVFSWNDFVFPIIFTNSLDKRTLSAQLFIFQNQYPQQVGMVAAYSLLVMALPFFLSMLFRRYVFNGLTLGVAQE